MIDIFFSLYLDLVGRYNGEKCPNAMCIIKQDWGGFVVNNRKSTLSNFSGRGEILLGWNLCTFRRVDAFCNDILRSREFRQKISFMRNLGFILGSFHSVS